MRIVVNYYNEPMSWTRYFTARDLYEAQYILDRIWRGEYMDPGTVESARIEIACPKHGWTASESGYCDRCLDDELG